MFYLRKKNIFLGKAMALLAAMSLFALWPAVVGAVEYGGVGGRPAYPKSDNPRTKSIFVFTLNPGDRVEDGVRVINNTEEEKTLMVYAVDSVVSSGGAFACAQFNDPKTDVGSWIKLKKNEVTLPPLSNEIIPFSIEAPASVDVGEHNGCIVIQEKKTDKAQSSRQGINLTFRTGLRVAVLIPGEIKRELEIVSFDITPSKGQYLAKAKVRNKGNVSIDSDVKVQVDYFFGKNYASAGGQYPILREEESEWNFKIDKPFWGGWYKAYLTVKYDPNAEAGVGTVSGKGFAVLTSQPIYFFVWPSAAAAVIELAVLLVIIIVIVRAVRLYRQRRWIKEKWVEYEVREGEDINSIADRFGVSWKLLARANNLRPPYTFKPGTKIKVPPHD